MCHLGVRVSSKDDQNVSRSVSKRMKSRDGLEYACMSIYTKNEAFHEVTSSSMGGRRPFLVDFIGEL